MSLNFISGGRKFRTVSYTLFYWAFSPLCRPLRNVCTFHWTNGTIRDHLSQTTNLSRCNLLAIDANAVKPYASEPILFDRVPGSFSGPLNRNKPVSWVNAACRALALLGRLFVLLTFVTSPAHSEEQWASLSSNGWAAVSAFDETARPASPAPKPAAWKMPVQGSPLSKLHTLISFAESWDGQYDAYHLSAKIPPPKKPSNMTIAEIFDWIDRTPRQHHAIGRYQFIPKTLRRVVAKSGLPKSTVFGSRVQDMLANVLIDEAGYSDLTTGTLPLPRFMDNLASIWAGLPAKNGRSVYHGQSGNRATITRTFFDQQMALIFGTANLKNKRGKTG